MKSPVVFPNKSEPASNNAGGIEAFKGNESRQKQAQRQRRQHKTGKMKNDNDKTTTFDQAMNAPTRHAAAEHIPAADTKEKTGTYLPDFTDIEEVRRAFIASEIFNRKY